MVSSLVFGLLPRIAAVLCACSAISCSFLAPLDEYDEGTTGGIGGGGGTTSSTTTTSSGAMCGPFDHPGTSSLIDRFDDGMPGPAWSPLLACTFAETGGEVIFTPPANDTEFCWYSSVDVFHLTCDTLTVKVTGTTSPVLGVQTFIYLIPEDGSVPLNLLHEAGGFRLAPDSGSGEIDIPLPYDPVADVWWRLREAEGTLYFETSPDGVDFVVRGSGVSPIPLDALEIRIGAGTHLPLATPGEARFDCYNAPAPCP
jgi:hypothetical protein